MGFYQFGAVMASPLMFIVQCLPAALLTYELQRLGDASIHTEGTTGKGSSQVKKLTTDKIFMGNRLLWFGVSVRYLPAVVL